MRRQGLISRWVFPAVADLIFLLALSAAIAAGAILVSWNGDSARHLTVGEHMLTNGRILSEDVFSYTRGGDPFVPYEWLSEVFTASSYRVGGLGGIALLYGAVIGATFAILHEQIVARGNGVLLAGLVTAMAMAASSFHWLARPHVFTFLGLAVFAAVLDGWYRQRLSSRALWVLPAVMIPWVNLHGGFLIGLGLIAVYLGADLLLATRDGWGSLAMARFRRLALMAAACCVTTALNPEGLGLFQHFYEAFRRGFIVDRTAEFMSPNFHQATFRSFLVMLIATIAAIAWSRRRLDLREGMLLIAFTVLALYSARHIVLFAIVVAPLLATELRAVELPKAGLLSRIDRIRQSWDGLDDRLSERDRWRSSHVWPLAVVMGLMAVSSLQLRAGMEETLGVAFDPTLQPVRAVKYLQREQPLGQGFNQIEWGGYLLHTLWPTDRVFIDGQTDFYGEALLREYIKVGNLEGGWQDVLDKYGVRWVLFNTDTPLVSALEASPGWRVTYQDAIATVLMR
jgi:hypothetical protein